MLEKAFLILDVCLFVRKNSCRNSSSLSWNQNAVPSLLFEADFSLFHCVFF